MHLTTILYWISTSPADLERLQAELDEATTRGELSTVVKYREAAKLPFLAAVMQESFRFHSLSGFPLPRVVPQGGMMICGQFLPAGCEVGVSTIALERSKEIFGEDADKYRPSRWLVNSDQIVFMEDAILKFGIGNRSCVGQNVSLSSLFHTPASC